MPTQDRFRFPDTLAQAVERCWRKAAPPPNWNVTPESFRALLERSVGQKFPGNRPLDKTIESYIESLHLADLALAAACAGGNEAAWEVFIAQYRPELYRAARAIAGESQGRELADSLYADLFGLRESAGQRKSLFDYFHGRSKLGTWLRAVLAQRHVDELRRTARTGPLDETADAAQVPGIAAGTSAAANATPDPERERFLAILQAAVTAVLAALHSRDRLRLACYYLNDLTLAQIGKLLGEHEATVSRKLERTRREVRARVEALLREDKKFSEAQLLQCFEYARDEWPFDLSTTLSAHE